MLSLLCGRGLEERIDETKTEGEDEQLAKKRMTRREAISTLGKVVIVVSAAAVIGAATYSAISRLSKPSPAPRIMTLRYFGAGELSLSSSAVEELKKTAGITIERTDSDFFTLAQRLIASRGEGWDVGFTGRLRAIIAAGVIAPIDVSRLPRWRAEWLTPLIARPESFLGPNYVKRFNQLLWKEVGRQLWAVPMLWNYDSVGYNPEIVPFEEQGGQSTTVSYGALWDPQYKGRTAMQDEAFTVFSEVANYLDYHKMLTVSDTVTNLNESELRQVSDFLKPILQAGQIKTFWSDFGKIVTLFATREIALASCWQPVVFNTRAAGVPCYYARMPEGPFFWWNGDILSVRIPEERLDATYKFFDFQMGPWWANHTAHNGYGIASPFAPDVRNLMGDEFWGWFYDGKPTYTPIDQIIKDTWPDRPEFQGLPERLQQALFRPEKYFVEGMPPRTGSPNPKGNLRDLGSIEDKNKITRYFLSPDFPDNPEAYQQAFSSLKAFMP